jgi:integrase
MRVSGVASNRTIVRTQNQALNAVDGRHSLGTPGLSLVVRGASRRYIFRYIGAPNGATIGHAKTMTPNEATAAAALLRGDAEIAALAAPAEPINKSEKVIVQRTFRQALDLYLPEVSKGWKGGRSGKNAINWRSMLELYALDSIGDFDPRDISRDHMRGILSPIWGTKAETAQRVRRRIAAVIADDAFEREVPRNEVADPGNIKKLMKIEHSGNKGRAATETGGKQGRRGSHPAPTMNALGRLCLYLHEHPSASGYVLLWTAYSAARIGMTLSMEWKDLDLENNIWVTPGSKMKMEVAQRTPITKSMRAILEAQGPRREGYVFRGQRGGPLSNMAPLQLVRGWLARDENADLAGFVPHGFRGSFKAWTINTRQDWTLAEMALAHAIPDRTAGAYAATDGLEPRRELLTAWCRTIDSAFEVERALA